MKRVLVLGSSSSGKTAFLDHISWGTFRMRCEFTDYRTVRNVRNIHFIDVPGQHMYGSNVLQGLGKIDAVIYMYSKGSRLSAKSIKHWKKRVREELGSGIPSMIIGTHSDIRHPQVGEDGPAHIDISSKTGRNVETALQIIENLV